MSKMIQIRNVPDELHRSLKIRSVNAGMSLSEYLLRELKKVAQRPDIDELLSRIRRREAPAISETPAEILREEREITS